MYKLEMIPEPGPRDLQLTMTNGKLGMVGSLTGEERKEAPERILRIRTQVSVLAASGFTPGAWDPLEPDFHSDHSEETADRRKIRFAPCGGGLAQRPLGTSALCGSGGLWQIACISKMVFCRLTHACEKQRSRRENLYSFL